MLHLMYLTPEEIITLGITGIIGIFWTLSIIFTKKPYRKYLTGFTSLFLCILIWLFYPDWFQWWGLLVFIAVIGVLFQEFHRKKNTFKEISAHSQDEDHLIWDTLKVPPQNSKEEGK